MERPVAEKDETARTPEVLPGLGALGASKGGTARAAARSPELRSAIARRAAEARWKNRPAEPQPRRKPGALPVAKHRGVLNLTNDVGTEVPCYVLDDGQRVIGRTSATELLTGIRGGGALEKYLGVAALKPFINM